MYIGLLEVLSAMYSQMQQATVCEIQNTYLMILYNNIHQ